MDILENSNGTKFAFVSFEEAAPSLQNDAIAKRHLERFGTLVCDLEGNLIKNETDLQLIDNEFVGTNPAEMYNDATDIAMCFLNECNPGWNSGVSTKEEEEIITLFAMRIIKDASLQKTILDYLKEREIKPLLSPVGIQYNYNP